MINNMFVFDCVIHAYDMSSENLRSDRPDAAAAREQMIRATRGAHGRDEYAKRWTADELYDLVFNQSPTDMAMAQVVPIYDWYQEWFAPVRAQYELAAAHPDRVLFCGGVDPLYQGINGALDQLQFQITELGARSIKFYNGHIDRSWRCDDRELAYPLYEKCLNLGVDVIQFHKGVPFGQQNVEDLAPNDLQAPARDFPELKFVIHHLALPYFEEAVNIASRFRNIYLALSGTFAYYPIAPRRVLEQLGRLLQEVGSSRLLWGSEAALAGSPAPYLNAIADMTMPEQLMDDYGYPQLTDDVKRKLLGLNFARLMNIDVEQKLAELYPADQAQPTGATAR